MPPPDWISPIIALVALIVSLVALVRLRRVNDRQIKLGEDHLELRRTTERLHAVQLEQLEEHRRKQTRGRLSARMSSDGRNYYFKIENTGDVKVSHVEFDLIDCPDSPLVRGDYDTKTPLACLRPGESVDLLAALSHSSPLTYQARVSWTDPDQSRRSETFHLSVS